MKAGQIMALAASWAVAACGPGQSGSAAGVGSAYSRQIEQLESADVAAEVEKATASEDYRFVAVMGVGVSVPGVPDYFGHYDRFGYRTLPGTSDAIQGHEHMRLQQVARVYAERYNALLLKKIPAESPR